MVKDTLFAVTLLILASCGYSEATPIGHGQYIVDGCRSARDCVLAAKEACPYGFELLDRESHEQGAMASSSGNTVMVTRFRRGSMLVQCHSSRPCESRSDCESGEACAKPENGSDRMVCRFEED